MPVAASAPRVPEPRYQHGCEDGTEPECSDEHALDDSHHAGQDLVGHGALQERQSGDVHDRRAEADDAEEKKRGRGVRHERENGER